jgi:BON domain
VRDELTATRRDSDGLLLAIVLGAAVLAARPPAVAQTPAAGVRAEPARQEVVISAPREADAVINERVTQVLHDDPYIYDAHISVVTENGIVTLQGLASDFPEMRRVLRLARRAAHGRRVVNNLEVIPEDLDRD